MHPPPPHLLLLVEGSSEERFLRAFLPQLGFVAGVDFFILPYDGGPHLMKRKTRNKLRGWKRPGIRRLVIQRDQEELSQDCRQVKREVEQWVARECPEQFQRLRVRISCRELEAWYLGDPDALWSLYPAADRQTRRRVEKHRDAPDETGEKPSVILREVAGRGAQFPKMNAAAPMGELLGRKCAASAAYYGRESGGAASRNGSPSFRCFARTMRETLEELRAAKNGK